MKWTLCFLPLLIIGSCKRSQKADPALMFMPPNQQLEKGVVAKFYKHNDKPEGGQKKTDIRYRSYSLNKDTLTWIDYNAAFFAIEKSNILTTNGKWKILDQDYLFPNQAAKDLVKAYTIIDSISLDWKNQKASNIKFMSYKDTDSSYYANYQISRKDTIYDGRKATVFSGYEEQQYFHSNDTVDYRFNWRKVFAQNLGLVHSDLSSKKYSIKWELAELMSIEEFNRRKDHKMHRVGWIDTTQVIDKKDGFSTCDHFSVINDYYNEDRASFKGKKGALRALLENKLEKDKLKGTTGYLTYRFVVNCNGKAGWFTTEEADLSYERKQFSSECRNHLFDILYEVKDWKSLSIGGKERDAYVYITFKLKDGEIIEVLP